MTDTETIEAVLLAKPRMPIVLIETAEALADAVQTLSGSTGPFALDAERASGFKYSQRAYLVQIHRQGTPIFLLDPVAVSPDHSAEPFQELANLLGTDEWVLHAASQDIPCLRELGITPSSLFDTELGSRIAGLPRVSLGAVCEHFLDLKLAKEHSAVDWSTRPLHADWLNYAALDVDVLLELREKLLQELINLEKLEWAEQEFANTAAMVAKAPKVDKWRSMTGLSNLKDTRKLAVAKALWEARESLAVKLDVSPGRLVPDASLVHVADALPKSRPELSSDRSFVGRASRSYLDTWWAAVELGLKARDLPPLKLKSEGIPNHRMWPGRFPDADARLRAVRPAVQELAESHNLAPENLITPDFVRQICWQPPEIISTTTIAERLLQLGARPWQVSLVSPCLEQALLQSKEHVEPKIAEG